MVRSFDQIIKVIYIDPMGKKINPEISATIINQLKVEDIGEPLLGSPVQYVQLDYTGSFIEEGNYDDCGAFLAYCVTSIVSGKKIRQDIKIPEQAISFGQYLRDAFSKKVGFDEIYQAGSISS